MSQNPGQRELAIEWFIQKIRRRGLDHPRHNDLTRNYDFNAEDIKDFMQGAICDFNEAEPSDISGYTIETFPSQEILIQGVLYRLYKGLADMHERNEMPWSASGVQANRHAMGRQLQAIANDYYGKFMRMTEEKKVSLNAMSIMRGARGIHSTYGILSWYNTRI